MRKKILLVDDSIAMARQLKNIVEDSGEFDVVGHAKNGIEGIKMFATAKPDIVCMDLVMPEMDGLQAIRSIISMDKNAKIVVISSVGGVGGNVTEALKFGAKNIITKPFDPLKVIEMLKSL